MSEGKKGFFGRLVEGRTKTRNSIVSGIDSIFSGFSAIDDDFYEEIEETLIMGDLGIQTTMSTVSYTHLDVYKRQIEAREIPHGEADVIVAEAFTGNVILKLYEGVGATLIAKVKAGMMTSLRSKIGALLVKPALKETLKSFDASQYGGAPLLGLNGLVVKTHGNSKRTEVCNSIIQCVTFKEQRINEKMKESLFPKEKEQEER